MLLQSNVARQADVGSSWAAEIKIRKTRAKAIAWPEVSINEQKMSQNYKQHEDSGNKPKVRYWRDQDQTWSEGIPGINTGTNRVWSQVTEDDDHSAMILSLTVL